MEDAGVEFRDSDRRWHHDDYGGHYQRGQLQGQVGNFQEGVLVPVEKTRHVQERLVTFAEEQV